MLRLTLTFRPVDGPQHRWDPGGGQSGLSPWLEHERQNWDLGGMRWLSRSSWKQSYIWWSWGCCCMVVFLRNETCKSLESNHVRRTPASTCEQDQRGKGTMLHFEDTLFVCSPPLSFMSSVASIGGGCTIHWCVGVEDSDIKEGWSFAFVPEILGLNVESCRSHLWTSQLFISRVALKYSHTSLRQKYCILHYLLP